MTREELQKMIDEITADIRLYGMRIFDRTCEGYRLCEIKRDLQRQLKEMR